MAFFSDALTYSGMLVQVVALILLLRGPVVRYFPLFLLLLTSTGISASLAWIYRAKGVGDVLYFRVYWGGEILCDLVQFLFVISLTMRALEGSRLRPMVVRILGMILAAVLILPFVFFDSAIFKGRWNASVAQLLNFGAGLMNLALWSALVVSRQRDRQLLMVCAGLGVTVAGSALALGVRRFTGQDDNLRVVAEAVYRICQIAGPAIWCWAFRPARPRLAVPRPAAGATFSAG